MDTSSKYASPEELRYAKVLDIGVKAGFVLLVLSFAAYLSGILSPHVPFDQLPRYWGLPVKEFVKATNTPTGWGWLSLSPRATSLNLVPIAYMAGFPPSAAWLCFRFLCGAGRRHTGHRGAADRRAGSRGIRRPDRGTVTRAKGDRLPKPFNRVLLATEGTEFDVGAERVAIDLAAKCGLPLLAVRPVVSNPEFEVVAPQLAEKAEAEAVQQLDRLREAAKARGVELLGVRSTR